MREIVIDAALLHQRKLNEDDLIVFANGYCPPLPRPVKPAVRFFQWIIQQRCAPPVPSAAQKP